MIIVMMMMTDDDFDYDNGDDYCDHDMYICDRICINTKCQDYVCVKWEYWVLFWK